MISLLCTEIESEVNSAVQNKRFHTTVLSGLRGLQSTALTEHTVETGPMSVWVASALGRGVPDLGKGLAGHRWTSSPMPNWLTVYSGFPGRVAHCAGSGPMTSLTVYCMHVFFSGKPAHKAQNSANKPQIRSSYHLRCRHSTVLTVSLKSHKRLTAFLKGGA